MTRNLVTRPNGSSLRTPSSPSINTRTALITYWANHEIKRRLTSYHLVKTYLCMKVLLYHIISNYISSSRHLQSLQIAILCITLGLLTLTDCLGSSYHERRNNDQDMYSSCLLNHSPVSFRPCGARSSHWYIPQSASRPRA